VRNISRNSTCGVSNDGGGQGGVHWLVSGASLENQQLPGGYSKNRRAKTIGKGSRIIGVSVRCDMSAAGAPHPLSMQIASPSQSSHSSTASGIDMLLVLLQEPATCPLHYHHNACRCFHMEAFFDRMIVLIFYLNGGG
jgi:hypothetical protein